MRHVGPQVIVSLVCGKESLRVNARIQWFESDEPADDVYLRRGDEFSISHGHPDRVFALVTLEGDHVIRSRTEIVALRSCPTPTALIGAPEISCRYST